jgi:hypothetical protein
MTLSLAPARAAAARRNGALSRGPKTAKGKARSAQNALKHGLCAEEFVVLHDEDEQAFAALEAALLDELAPQGVLQRLLAGRIVRAAWRLERAERIETEMFEEYKQGDGDLALALIRDGNGARSFDTLLRYRGSALAEFFRALRLLQALQDEARAIVAPRPAAAETSSPRQRNEPKTRTNPEEIAAAAIERDPGDRSGASAAAPARHEYQLPSRGTTIDRTNRKAAQTLANKPVSGGLSDCRGAAVARPA